VSDPQRGVPAAPGDHDQPTPRRRFLGSTIPAAVDDETRREYAEAREAARQSSRGSRNEGHSHQWTRKD
jgi:hypothetical protein